jgi:hypothetical protein
MTGPMTDAAPSPPNRRAVWIVRLVFYPVALGLIAVAWHQRHAAADDARPRTSDWAMLAGRTANGDPATARYRDGRPDRITFRLLYACTPDVGWPVWATYVERPVAADGRVRVRDHGSLTTWSNGWVAETTLDVDGRYDDDRLTGAVAARMRLDANGVRSDCRAERLGLDVARSPGAKASTVQGEPVTARVVGGRVAAFSIGLQLACSDHDERHVVWAPPITPRDGTAITRDVRAIGRQYEVLLGPVRATTSGGARSGTMSARFTAVSGGAVRGTAEADLPLDDGTACGTPTGGVPFTVQAD